MSIFTLIAISMAVHSCYIGSKVVVSLFALSQGSSQVTVGMLAACYALFPLLLGVYTGRLADTRGLRMPLMVGAGLTCVAMMTGFLWRDLAGLFAVAAMMGAGFVLFNVSVQTLAGALGEGGKTLMPPDDYGFSRRFGWTQDRFGVSTRTLLRSHSV